jgi:hypothetical protein
MPKGQRLVFLWVSHYTSRPAVIAPLVLLRRAFDSIFKSITLYTTEMTYYEWIIVYNGSPGLKLNH